MRPTAPSTPDGSSRAAAPAGGRDGASSSHHRQAKHAHQLRGWSRGCTRCCIRAGKPFLEPANTPHLARNEGKRTAVFYAIVNFRKGGESEDDAPRPASCDT